MNGQKSSSKTSDGVDGQVDTAVMRRINIATKLFMDNFDCYADLGKSGFKSNIDIPAMTKERFVEIVKDILFYIEHHHPEPLKAGARWDNVWREFG